MTQPSGSISPDMGAAALRDLFDRAAATRAHIVLSEGHDPRIVAGAVAAEQHGIARITVLGDADTIAPMIAAHGGTDAITIENPATSPRARPPLASALHELRAHKGMTEKDAAKTVRDPLIFAALLVRLGHADGTVGGAVHTTSDTVRAALQIIGKAPETPLVSSFFLMVPPDGHPAQSGPMVFGDCGLVIDPDANELAAIAAASARSYHQLVQRAPKVALLSFSTKGSATHERVSKVQEAHPAFCDRCTPIWTAKANCNSMRPSFLMSGPPRPLARPLRAVPMSWCFPILMRGTSVIRSPSGSVDFTPLVLSLQGLAKPANDLSRGCNAQDVLGMIAITAPSSPPALTPGAIMPQPVIDLSPPCVG